MQQQQALAQQHQAMAQQHQQQQQQQHQHQQMHHMQHMHGGPSSFGPPPGYGQQPPPPPLSAPAPPPQPLPELVPPPPEQISTNCLWVGYPAQSISEDELRPVFAQFGPIDNIRAIVQKNCAFVTFQDRQSAWMCINTLQRSPVTIRGFTFRLGWGKPTDQMGAPAGGSAGLPMASPSNCLWLGSVNFDLSEDELYGPFSRFGTIENIRLLPAKKCAFITFSNVAEAELALREMQGQAIRGERLKINFGHGGTAVKKDEETRLAPVPEVGPPNNRDVAMVIEQLAAFVHRLGVAFEEKVAKRLFLFWFDIPSLFIFLSQGERSAKGEP